MKVVEEVIVSRLRPRVGFDSKSCVCRRDVLLWCLGGLAGVEADHGTLVATPRAEFLSSALAGQATDWQMIH